MRILNNDALHCSNPGIVAGRLISIRNIYLRQELHTISNQIQANYKERLPTLDLVSLAAYEQVFHRQVTYQIRKEMKSFFENNSHYLFPKNCDEMLLNMDLNITNLISRN